MSNNVNDRGGSSNDRVRVPGFDDYVSMTDAIKKYEGDLRKYFAQAETHDQLKQAKQELIDSEENDYPDKIISFFYNERLRSLGPNHISSDSHKHDDSESALNFKVNKAREEQANMMTKYRPTWK